MTTPTRLVTKFEVLDAFCRTHHVTELLGPRFDRGWAIMREGAVQSREILGTFTVKEYIVTLDPMGSKHTCNCPDFEHRAPLATVHFCKHIIAAWTAMYVLALNLESREEVSA